MSSAQAAFTCEDASIAAPLIKNYFHLKISGEDWFRTLQNKNKNKQNENFVSSALFYSFFYDFSHNSYEDHLENFIDFKL